MLPLAPGAKGQPPSPPTEASSWVTPAWSAASALAWPVPRVSWKCTPSGVPGVARRTASSNRTTRTGVVVPIVSPRHSWSAPAVTAAPVTSTVRAIGVGPSNGQSQAVATMTSSEPPAPCASSAISPTAATASAVDRPALARLCESDAETTYSRCAMPASTARTAPRGLATRAEKCTPSNWCSSAATWSASARAGTALGDTNEVTSIRRTPVATSASSITSLSVSGSGSSNCSPSRIPTSRTSTVVGSTRSNSFMSASCPSFHVERGERGSAPSGTAPGRGAMRSIAMRSMQGAAHRHGAGVRGGDPGGVGLPVVGGLLRPPFGLDPGPVALDLVGDPLVVPAEHAGHRPGDRLGRLDAPVGGLDRDAGAAGEQVVQVQRALVCGAPHHLDHQVLLGAGHRLEQRGGVLCQVQHPGGERNEPGEEVLGAEVRDAPALAQPVQGVDHRRVALGADQRDVLGDAGRHRPGDVLGDGVHGVGGHRSVGRVLAPGDGDDAGHRPGHGVLAR